MGEVGGFPINMYICSTAYRRTVVIAGGGAGPSDVVPWSPAGVDGCQRRAAAAHGGTDRSEVPAER